MGVPGAKIRFARAGKLETPGVRVESDGESLP
jgi:hypothetical protein